MEAKEMRLGNYFLNDKNQPTQWEAWHFDHYKYDMPNPIPLTEEWLFKMNMPENEISLNLFNHYEVYFQRLENKLYLMSEDGGKRHIEFVHTAQNIYYALNKTELPINL